MHTALHVWPMMCEECCAAPRFFLNIQLEHCKRCNLVICGDCFAKNCSAGLERDPRVPYIHGWQYYGLRKRFTSAHRRHYLDKEVPSLLPQIGRPRPVQPGGHIVNTLLVTGRRDIEDSSDSWSSSVSAQDGSQGDADTQELRTEVIIRTLRDELENLSGGPEGPISQLECEQCWTTFSGREEESTCIKCTGLLCGRCMTYRSCVRPGGPAGSNHQPVDCASSRPNRPWMVELERALEWQRERRVQQAFDQYDEESARHSSEATQLVEPVPEPFPAETLL